MEQNTNALPQVETPMVAPASPTPPLPPPAKSRLLPLLIILGLTVVVAVPALYFTLFQKPAVETPVEQVAVPIPSPTPLFLNIDNPKADVTAVNGEVLVSGKTLPNTTVVIFTDTDEAVIESDLAGKFEETVVVGDAGGLLKITAYAINGEEVSETFMVSASPSLSSVLGVFASSPVIAKNDNAPKNADNQNQGKSVKNQTGNQVLAQAPTPTRTPKVKEFLGAKTNPRKLEKVGLDQLKHILTTGSTSSADLKKNSGRGDKTATASAKLNLKKMEAQQATAGAALKRHAVSGVITDVADGMVTIAHQIQRSRVSTVYYNVNTVISMKGVDSTTPATLTVGMRIVAVGEPANDGLLAKRIHVIPGKATGVFTKNPVATKSGDASKSADASQSATLTPTATPTASASAQLTPTPSATPTVTIKPSPSATPTTPATP